MHTAEGPWSMVLGHFEGSGLADTFDILPGVRLLEYSLRAELVTDADTWKRVLLASTQALGRLVELSSQEDALAADGARSLSKLVAEMSGGRRS